jgi:hypothetical protein
MAKNGFRVLDSDIHIIEPPDLWARYIDAPFKHQAPRGFADWVLDLRIEIDGKLMPANVSYSADARGRSAQHDHERFRSFHERGWSAAAQLEAMDQEGIDVGVVYPTRGSWSRLCFQVNSISNLRAFDVGDCRSRQAMQRLGNKNLREICVGKCASSSATGSQWRVWRSWISRKRTPERR